MGPGQRLEGWGGVKSKPAEQEVISPSGREHIEPAGRRWRSSRSCMEACPPSPWGRGGSLRAEESQWGILKGMLSQGHCAHLGGTGVGDGQFTFEVYLSYFDQLDN